jgi:hypothetical protein
LGETGVRYVRAFKALGAVGEVLSISTTVDDIVTDYNNGKRASAIGRGVVAAVTVGTEFIPVVGPLFRLV